MIDDFNERKELKFFNKINDVPYHIEPIDKRPPLKNEFDFYPKPDF